MVVIALTMLGWIIPVTIGFFHLRRGMRSGITLSVLGGIWGLAVILTIGPMMANDASTIGARGVIRALIHLGWLVPAGVGALFLRRRDRAGIALALFGCAWGIGGLWMMGRDIRRAVTGPPYTASIDVMQQSADSARLELKLVGHNGESYSVWRFRDRTDPPGFQVISESGTVLWQGRIEPG